MNANSQISQTETRTFNNQCVHGMNYIAVAAPWLEWAARSRWNRNLENVGTTILLILFYCDASFHLFPHHIDLSKNTSIIIYTNYCQCPLKPIKIILLL